jgi:predicted dehydrogenase
MKKSAATAIRTGIWGLGRAGIGMHLPEIRGYPELFGVVAACDTVEDRRRAMSEKCACRLYSSPEEFLGDPAQKLKGRRAKSGNPPLNSFGTAESLRWIERDVKVAPRARCGTTFIWEHLYQSIRERTPFPITLAQGVEVVRIAESARKGTVFDTRLRA